MSQTQFREPVFFIDADKATGQSHRIIDQAVFNEESQAYTSFGGKSLADMQVSYPGLQVGEFDEVLLAKEEFYRHQGIFEIDEEAFMDALECLPPVDWKRVGEIESFKLSERLTGNITSIFCRKGQRYFRFYDLITLDSAGIARRLDKGIEEIEAAKSPSVQIA